VPVQACNGVYFNFTFTKKDRNNSDFHPSMAVLGFGLRLHFYNIYFKICLRKESVTVLEDDIKVDI
jgi:hypothetical protein